ncbi:MAG: OmpH family outer membrane protein [Bacteroidales bacterium]|nr:OmpH family outer membrane protein [Bacteroidales bacterium]MCR4856886.1 OmpH family outer membrane protein [Bacteroidales bacterium]
MKKLTIIILCLLATLAGFSQKAKFGHVDYGALMKEMPGIDTAQQALIDYQKELEETGQQMVNEFKEKQAAYMQLTNSGASSAILKVKEDEMMKLYERIQEFASISEQDLQQKQLALLQPFQDKLLEAIKKVASAGNYTYIFDVSTLAFHNESDDLTEAVKAQIKK